MPKTDWVWDISLTPPFRRERETNGANKQPKVAGEVVLQGN